MSTLKFYFPIHMVLSRDNQGVFFMISFCKVILVETIYRFSTKAITDFCNTVPPQPWQICHHLEVFP